ncbi:uncharacterized protein EDB93DRAFT_1304018 [Suillus bovinus]|uniref:uncharacterized protein n=1 Tax=Suillus bovinus TaxID=48563 RepID=UPI001B864C93|nr:uncharacterized protein EDB93DRAFT_1304018 [Suillus bovinus]KAG2157614.1 hypothetical protein EDB93DRAFT_1304018 [Suillus bovinus]
MATSGYQGHCRTSSQEGNDRDDAVIMPKTASVTPLAANIPLTPPRSKRVSGLVTPPATPDSRSRPNSSGVCFASPPRTPVRYPDLLKNTEPLAISRNLSEWSSDQLITKSFPPLAGLLTPDNTPPRLSKSRFVPTNQKEETKDKSKPSLSVEITSTVLEIPEISKHHAEIIQNTRDSGPITTRCNVIKSVKDPDPYRTSHIDQDTRPPSSYASASVRSPQLRQSRDIAAKSTTDVNSLCHGLTLRGMFNADVQSNLRLDTAISIDKCESRIAMGLTLRGAFNADVQSNLRLDTAISMCPKVLIPLPHPPQPKPVTNVNSLCHGLTLRGIQCRRSVKPPARYCYQHASQSTNTPTAPSLKPVTNANPHCCGLTLRGVQCRRSVKPPARYCYQHGSQSTQTPTTPIIASVQITVQCNAKSKSRRCQQRVSITPGQLTNDSSQPIYCRHHIPSSVGIVTYVDKEKFKVQPVAGQEEISVHFRDYIPEYLQRDSQQKLRNAITGNISERLKIPGYVYALNVFDPENEEKLSLKIGYSKDVKKRHAQWKNKCRSSIKDVRGWWPQTIVEAKDDDEMEIRKLIQDNRQGHKGPMAEQLERLVHIELEDLVTHTPYLHPNFPDVHYSDIPRQSKVVSKPCRDCNGTKHKEVFSFTRVTEGEFFEREWEDIVKPVIRKWGLFLKTYFAQGSA